MNTTVYVNMFYDRPGKQLPAVLIQFPILFNRPPACRVPNVSFRPLPFPCDRSRPGRRLDLVPVQNGMRSKAKNDEGNICLPIQFPKLAGSAPAGRRLNVSSRPRIASRPIEKNSFMCGLDTPATVANASVLARPQQGGKTRRSGDCSSCRCGSPKQTPTFITLAERRTDGRRHSATPSVCKARQSPQKLWSPPKGLCVRWHPCFVHRLPQLGSQTSWRARSHPRLSL